MFCGSGSDVLECFLVVVLGSIFWSWFDLLECFVLCGVGLDLLGIFWCGSGLDWLECFWYFV